MCDKEAACSTSTTTLNRIPSSYIPLVEPATKTDLRNISDSLKLAIPDDQLEVYLDQLNNTLAVYDMLRDIPEETLPILYPRIPGVKVPREDDPHNAWACKTKIIGESTGLLAGKRVAIKDNIFIAGTPLENGSKIWYGYTPECDATVVTRILKAGGVILGKSKCENQCRSGGSFTCAQGPCLNAIDSTRQAGGSSSGSATLIALGEVDMALGGDQGGSIRMPASWSGCVGLKPTWGLVPVTGSLEMEPTLDHIGPMARTVTDVALLLESIAGYDEGRDHRQFPNMALTGDLRGKRLGYVAEGFKTTTAGVKSIIDKIVERIRGAGAIVDVISLPEHLTAPGMMTMTAGAVYHSLYPGLGQAPGYKELYCRSAIVHLKKALQTQAHDIQPAIKSNLLVGEYLKNKDGQCVTAMAMNARFWFTRAYNRALEKYDGLIMPTVNFVARKLPDKDIKLDDYFKEATCSRTNTTAANISGHPAISLPVGRVLPETDDGQGGDIPLPVGLQITGKMFDEATLLDLAYGIERLVLHSEESSVIPG